MTTKPKAELEQKIERLVRELLEAQRKSVAAAVERAFASSSRLPMKLVAARVSGVRRAPTEMASLAEQLYAAVRENPGETMTVIAAQLGEKPRALNRPMFLLKSAGKVRSAGLHQHTRYFPMALSRPA